MAVLCDIFSAVFIRFCLFAWSVLVGALVVWGISR